MSQLSAQSIQRLCQPRKWFGLVAQQPMVVPFSSEKVVVHGKSAGLSSASYDVRIAHDLTLAPNPAYLLRDILINGRSGWLAQDVIDGFKSRLTNYPKSAALAHTIEDFYLPGNVVGCVMDKSSYARVFVTAFNTWIDPGFQGNLTLELVNLGEEFVDYKAGDPVCQIEFRWLDRRTDHPYRGKYFNQTKAAHPARYEDAV